MPSLPSLLATNEAIDATAWHNLSVKDVLKKTNSSIDGLTSQQIQKQRQEYGPNELFKETTNRVWVIFFNQLKSLLVTILAIAAVVSFLLDEKIDSLAIILIISINTLVGFIQEYKADQAIKALKKMEAHTARVRRQGKEIIIPRLEIVPGDILLLREGDSIAADGRITQAFSFQTNEAILTGESAPVDKNIATANIGTRLINATNLVFASTGVVRGRAEAVVIATGKQTQFGQIAHFVQQTKEAPTPLQHTLNRLTKIVGLVSIVAAIPCFLVGIIQGKEVVEMLLLAIALAVSSIPEGLAVIVTVALAIATRRILKHQVLVRKLAAVETLGGVDVICVDKTGTITENRMRTVQLQTANYTFEDLSQKTPTVKQQTDQELQQAATCAILCNDAVNGHGDATEQALIELTNYIKLDPEITKAERIDELPFTSAQKFMITLYQQGNRKTAYLKGAPEIVLNHCTSYQDGSRIKPLTIKQKAIFQQQLNDLLKQGLRVLGLAYLKVGEPKLKHRRDYTMIGFVGLLDTPRKEIAAALAECKSAGVRVMMITGDHPLTAQTVAQKIGLAATMTITGDQLEKMSRQQLEQIVEQCQVFARVSPIHKLTILRALHNRGHVVAMTGDGVNDTPALKEADIGIAVADATDLAKEVSDMILLDNNFASIVTAIREARGIFFNIKKSITLLIAANFDEVFLIMAALLLNTPLPLLPIHLLWLNVVTDTLPALALAGDSYREDLMSRGPYKPQTEILAGVLRFSIAAGIIGFVVTFGVFLSEYYFSFSSLALAQTATLVAMAVFEWFLAWSVRSEEGIWNKKFFANKWLWAAIITSFGLQLLVLYVPFINEIFQLTPLGLLTWFKVTLFAIGGIVLLEGIRLIKHHRTEIVEKLIALQKQFLARLSHQQA